MKTKGLLLEGKHVRLEPLERYHKERLAAAAGVDSGCISGALCRKAKPKLPNT